MHRVTPMPRDGCSRSAMGAKRSSSKQPSIRRRNRLGGVLSHNRQKVARSDRYQVVGRDEQRFGALAWSDIVVREWQMFVRTSSPFVRLGVIALTSIPVLLTRRSAAAVAPPLICVAYRAPATCPDRDTFMQYVTRRVSPSWFTDDEKMGQPISITVEVDGEQISGRMEYDDRSGHPVVRRLWGRECEDVVSGLALVAALAAESYHDDADGSAVLNASEETEPLHLRKDDEKHAVARSAAAPPDAAKRQGDKQATLPSSPARGRLQPSAVSSRAAARGPPPRQTPIDQYLGLNAGVRSGVGPKLASEVGVEWGFGLRPGLPLLRVAANWASETSSRSEGSASFQLISMQSQGCIGMALLPSPITTTSICAGAEVGYYSASAKANAGTPFLERSAPALLWLALGSSVHVQLNAGPIYFDFSPRFGFPFRRRQYSWLTETNQINEIPKFSYGAVGGIGVTFR
jgi:hypothetical protein